ncbi:hypothetical protein AB205_0126290 [Aquarana catesbeiana]|uniref:Secreted protein n=1 Tax=Aquarana catesbeiana TaxID=8400 RepID=A0A2G9RFD9_AQUCT|nr:hypothetical protein AB205_0126290 [Aquarana catesbeiana]
MLYCNVLLLLCFYRVCFADMSYCYTVMLLCVIVNHYLFCRYAIQLQHRFILTATGFALMIRKSVTPAL